jgi:steroid delta-isomerase-like uncharacterized protein
MSVERTREILMAYLDSLVRRAPYGEFFTNDATFTIMGAGQEVKGGPEVTAYIRAFHEQAFDAHPSVKTMMVGDGRAAIEVDFVGTHIGEFGGVPASGNSINVPYAVVYDFRDDKISALRLYMPMDVLFKQIQSTELAAVASN